MFRADAYPAQDVTQLSMQCHDVSMTPPQDNLQRTALHWAAEMGHAETAKALMDFGADVDAAECNGRYVRQEQEAIGCAPCIHSQKHPHSMPFTIPELLEQNIKHRNAEAMCLVVAGLLCT